MASILPLEVEGLRFRYGRLAVLRGVDLRVEAGEVVALLGPNGAGKTTLFRLLTGAEQPEAGQRSFAGQARREIDVATRARFAHLAHQPQIYPLLTARENVDMFCRFAAVPAEARARVESSLARLGLEAHMDRRVGTFSRGMAQRVALARAIALAPELLILDEPFTALDPRGRGELSTLLREMADAGAGVLIASHDLDAVASTADRACVLREGRIVATIVRRPGEAEPFRRELAASLTGTRVGSASPLHGPAAMA